MKSVDKETKARLGSGDVTGIALQDGEQHEEGVLATRKSDNKKVFLPKFFVDIIRYRNRGKD